MLKKWSLYNSYCFVGVHFVLTYCNPEINSFKTLSEKSIFFNYFTLCFSKVSIPKVLALPVIKTAHTCICTVMWWDDSHSWNVAIYDYKLFRSDRWGRRGGGVAIYTRKEIECEELYVKNSHEPAQQLLREPCDQCLLQVIQSRGPCGWGLLLPDKGGVAIASTHPDGDFSDPDIC